MRGVILVERTNLTVDEVGRYRLHLTETPWTGEQAEPKPRDRELTLPLRQA
ncbi:hypothetical protein HLK59_29395 [Streptomyces sp. S3(2020)]|uniref:hypothetical protein n=1 Tax=Streptomyces sp. S3(2020) TaxID=2732044 RepID=UPI00148943EF|nr:hypothetical protein [Streptomyces sp. S3(2020)]NNN34405.1 hypothetical protein [Streptomyces sp. S3(2020)]